MSKATGRPQKLGLADEPISAGGELAIDNLQAGCDCKQVNRISNGSTNALSDADLYRDCHAVLLPVADTLDMPPWLEELLRGGVTSVLLAETREEYVAREMSDDRLRRETGEEIRAFIGRLAAKTQGDLLVAVDQEPWGIRRLHDLVPTLLSPSEIAYAEPSKVEAGAKAVARSAKELGVSIFLSPVVDILTGENDWLHGRTLEGPDGHHQGVGRAAAAYVAGTQAGGVATVTKHFPGFPRVTADPALDAEAIVPKGSWDERSLEPFKDVISAGGAGVMLGPAIVEDIDEGEPASTSPTIAGMLRRDLAFGGIIVSDDLDAPATLRNRSLGATMVDSLRAGADLLLVGGGEHLQGQIEAIFQAARSDSSLAHGIRHSARRVRAVAGIFGRLR